MDDFAETTFVIKELLVSIVPQQDPSIKRYHTLAGTVINPTVATYAPLFWPTNNALLCDAEGNVAPSIEGDPPLLNKVKALLQEQIANLQTQTQTQKSIDGAKRAELQVLKDKLQAAINDVSDRIANVES